MKTKLLTLAGALTLATSSIAHAEYLLPEVEKCGSTIQTILSGGLDNLQCLKGSVTAMSPGTYVASYHDEFLSYSIEALATIQSKQKQLPIGEQWLRTDVFGDWGSIKAGSGTLDIGALVKANGPGVLNNPDPFPDAIASITSATLYDATWGANTGTDTGKNPDDAEGDTILTVAEVVSWLAPQKIPAFFFDLADPGNQLTDMYISGRIFITDSAGLDKNGNGNILDEWAFDNIFDGTLNTSSMVLAPKNVPMYLPGSGCTPTGDYAALGPDWCMIKNSLGSGHPEFITYAPGMDLQKWAKDGNLFGGYFKISSTSAADEEIYLTKRINTPTNVPEPGTLALFATTLFGLSFVRRRKINK